MSSMSIRCKSSECLLRLTNNIEGQICGVLVDSKLFASGGLLLHKLDEGLRLVQDDLDETKKM